MQGLHKYISNTSSFFQKDLINEDLIFAYFILFVKHHLQNKRYEVYLFLVIIDQEFAINRSINLSWSDKKSGFKLKAVSPSLRAFS